MALSLGDISFGLGADTKGLQRAVDMMSRFAKQVDATVNAQVKGADQVAKSYAKQEHAMRSALQQVLALQGALRKSAAPPEMLARTTNAFQAFTRVLSSGVVDAVTMSRAQDRLQANLNKVRREFSAFAPPDDTKWGKFAKVMRDIESASVLAVGPLSGLGSRIRAIASITGRSTLAMAGFLGAVSAIIIATGKLITSSIATAKVFDTLNSGLAAATGSATTGGQAFDFVREVAQKLGIDLVPAAQGFVKLAAAAKGTKLEGKETKEIFLGVVDAGRALNLSGEQIERMLNAVQQMMSKGTVQSEELKNQLGDALPGAMQLAARAMGKNTAEFQKMLAQGQVLADDFLPRFARILQDVYGGDAVKAANNLVAVQARLNNSALLMINTFDRAAGVSAAYKATLSGLTGIVDAVTNNMTGLLSVIAAVAGAFLGMVAPHIISGLIAVGNAIRLIAVAMLGLNAAFAASPAGFFLTLLLRIALAASGAAAAFYAMKAALDENGDSTKKLLSDIDDYVSKSQKYKTATQSVTDALIDAARAEKINAQAKVDAAQAAVMAAQANVDRLREIQGRSGKLARQQGRGQDMGAAQGQLDQALQKLAEANGVITQLNLRIEQLSGLTNAAPADISQLSKAFDTAKDKIRDMGIELKGFQDALAHRDQGVGVAQWYVDLAKARDIIKEVKEGELPGLQVELAKLGARGTDVVEMLADLIRQSRDAETAFKGWADRTRDTTKVLNDLEMEMNEIISKTAALKAGPKAFEEWKKANDSAKALEQYRLKLAETGLSQDQITAKVNEFHAALENQDAAQRAFDRMDAMRKTAVQGFDRAFDRIGEAITQAFVTGEDAAISWGNVVQGVLSEVMQTMFEMVALNPLKQLFGNFVSTALGSMTGGGGLDYAGRTDFVNSLGIGTFGKHGLINNKRGNILTKPTIFPMAQGGMGIAREAGQDEAVLPLTRVSGGDLGVKAEGGGGTTNVYIINQTKAKTSVEESQNSSGGKDIKIVIAEAVAQNIRNNGAVGKAISQSFDISRRKAAR